MQARYIEAVTPAGLIPHTRPGEWPADMAPSRFAANIRIDSTQGYHGLMSVALIPLWMLSGAMFPASGSGWVRWLMRVDPMTYRKVGQRTYEAYLARARWMTNVGYRLLLT